MDDHLESGSAGPLPHLNVLDLGSGGGVPGLVLALRWPVAEIWLLEGSTRRAAFLRLAIGRLELTNRVRVLAERAELAGRGPLRGHLDVVTSRAFGRPAVVAECGAPFLRIGGLLAVSEPPEPRVDATRWPADGLAVCGLALEATRSPNRRFQVLRQVAACPDQFPRRNGVPAKRPLF